MSVRGVLIGVACVLMCGMLGFSGCKKKPSDAVLAQYEKGEKAIASFNLEAYKATVSPDSLAALENELRLAIRATEKELKALRPSSMMIVLALRNRQAGVYLKEMKPDDYLVWLMEQGFIVVDAESDIYPYEVRINGNTATVQMGEKVQTRSSGMRYGRRRSAAALAAALIPRSQLEPIEGYVLTYKRVNGVWLSDGEALAKEMDDYIIAAAKSEEMKVPDFLAMMEEDAHGSLKKDVWSPPK